MISITPYFLAQWVIFQFGPETRTKHPGKMLKAQVATPMTAP